MRYPSTIPLFPHDERKAAVTKDGRPYYRQYIPNFVQLDHDPESFFCDSFQDVADFLKETTSFEFEIIIDTEKDYYPENLVLVFDPKGGSKIVVGWIQNCPIPENYRTFKQLQEALKKS